GSGRARALGSPGWLAEQLCISSSAAWAQVHLARRLRALPAVAAAYDAGALSGQHASVVVRLVDRVVNGDGDQHEAERVMLREAQGCDPRTLLRRGLSLVHQLAPRELESEEGRSGERC